MSEAKFGEPWTVGVAQYALPEIVTADELHVTDRVFNGFAPRIIACVNACQGIENPAAIPALIEAAKAVADGIQEGFATVDIANSVIGDWQTTLVSALAALEEGK